MTNSLVGNVLRRLMPQSLRNKIRGGHSGPSGVQVLANGGVILCDKFLDPQEFIKIQHWALNTVCEKTREDRNWAPTLIRDFGECLGSRQWSTAHDDMPDELRAFTEALRKTGFIDPDAEIHIGVYRWHSTSGMGEHQDAHTDTAVTFYLNDIWKEDWFGDFIFYESKEEKENGFGHAVTPLANRLVVNRNTVPHKVTYTSSLAVDRITLQAFLPKQK